MSAGGSSSSLSRALAASGLPIPGVSDSARPMMRTFVGPIAGAFCASWRMVWTAAT